MIYLCSFLRYTDGLFGRCFLIGFFLLLGLLPFSNPDSLRVPFWLLPTVSAIVICYTLTSQRVYYCPDNEVVCLRMLWLGLPIWPPRTIRQHDICGLVVKSECDKEMWHDFSVELRYQEFLVGSLGEVKSIVIMVRRGKAGAVTKEARLVARELGVELLDQRKQRVSV